MVIDLKGKWLISGGKIKDLPISIPGSVISGLLKNHLIDNPYYGDNEEKARKYLYDGYTFIKVFKINKKALKQHNYLFIDKIDTIAKIYINDIYIGETKDFHISQYILLDSNILKDENVIKFMFTSNYKYINDYDDKGLFKTYSETDPKSVVARKPNYMFGWDWAPNLADMGIIGDIKILSTNEGFLSSYRYEYEFLNNNQLKLDIGIDFVKHNDSLISVELSLNNKVIVHDSIELKEQNRFSFIIDNPKLWYPNGFGEQTLYDLTIKTRENEYHYRIGFKKMDFDFSKTEEGRNFEVFVNGTSLFLKGYNIVPEDNILPFINNERTNKLLELAANSHANILRVWGGGYYPNDYFYQRCDELGLLVWQDLMFADAAYNYEDEDFMSLAREEVTQQVKRIRNHPSVLLICGNNENETALNGHEEIFKEHFIKMFCNDIKDIVKTYTNLMYLHSSPTNLDPIFNRPNDPNIFDVHYWEIGNGNLSYEAYSDIFPPMLSEFGLWSMPNYQTLIKYVSEKERYLYSKEIEAHNKREGNFQRAEDNIKSEFKFNNDIRIYSYLTQLYQARAVKYCIEHLRNNQSICHGGIYWQLNDSWPVYSPSVIDYEYGLKAVYYYAKRFFYNEIITISEQTNKINICISNLDNKEHHYLVVYKHMNFNNDVFAQENLELDIKPTSSKIILKVDSPILKEDEFLYVEMLDENGIVASNIYQKFKDKDIKYPKADFVIERISKQKYKVTAKTFIKDLYLEVPDVVFSNNYLTLLKDQEIILTVNKDFDIKDIISLNVNDL